MGMVQAAPRWMPAVLDTMLRRPVSAPGVEYSPWMIQTPGMCSLWLGPPLSACGRSSAVFMTYPQSHKLGKWGLRIHLWLLLSRD